jgi:hypothetical protein
MPTREDQARVLVQESLNAVLSDDWETVLSDFVEAHIGPERAATWGPVDTSVNDIADFARQVTTPGFYGMRPAVMNTEDPDAAERLIGEGGLLDSANLWNKLQHIEYMAVGMGEYLIRPTVDTTGLIGLRAVAPHWVYAESHPDDPSRPVVIGELRPRFLPRLDSWLWCWDHYSIKFGEESYKVLAAEGKTGKGVVITKGDDLSADFLASEDNPRGDYTGAAYPFRWEGGTGYAYLPYAWYRSLDTMALWGFSHRRGPLRGTLNSGLLSTYAMQSARDATGRAIIAAGLMPMVGEVQDAGQPNQVRSVVVKPGAIMYHQAMEGAQPFVQEIGPGAMLQQISQYASQYSGRIASRFGLNPEAATRKAANPTSAAALAITDTQRREFSAQLEPLFRASDLKLIRMIAALWNAAMAGDASPAMPERGYTITYQAVPKTPDEMEADREQWAWEEERGLLSKIQLYQRQHPGATRDAALAALRQVAADDAELSAVLPPDDDDEPDGGADEG